MKGFFLFLDLQQILGMAMYLSLIINEDTKFGMQMESKQPISKIIQVLRKFKVIPPELKDTDLKILNGIREVVFLTDLIQKLNCQHRHNPKLLIFMPQQHYNYTLIASRLNEMKGGGRDRESSSGGSSNINSESSIADKIIVHLKRVFDEIQRKNFAKIIDMKEEGKISPQLMDIFVSYTTEYRKYWSLFEVYRQLTVLMQQGEEIEAAKFLLQIDKRFVLEKEDREDIIRKINQFRDKLEELKENSQLRQKINLLEMEVNHYKKELQYKEEEMARLQMDKNQVEFLLKSAADRQNQLESQLKRESNSFEEKLKKAMQEKKKNEETVANANKQIQELRKMHEQKDKKLAKMEGLLKLPNQVQYLEQQLKQARIEIDLKKAEMVQLVNHYQGFEQKLQKRSTFLLSPPFQASSTVFNDFIDLYPLSSGEIIYQIESKVSKEILNVTPLFIFSKHASENFIKSLEDRPNLLLIARTVEGKIIGGFSRAPLSKFEVKSSQKSFLFHSQESEAVIIPLKQGRRSLTYDTDFLTFGEEELCIEQGSCWLQSQIQEMTADRLSFDWKQGQRAGFLTIKQKRENDRFKNEKKMKEDDKAAKESSSQKIKRIQLQDYVCLTLEFSGQQQP